ncbi:hypothetical protein AB0N37_22215 [Streptomyces griseoincarnatus]
MSQQPTLHYGEMGWVAITRDASGQLRTQGVRIFELGDEGVTALLKNGDGTHVEDPNVIDVIKGDPLGVAKLVAMLQLKELADRATTPAQVDAVGAVADWVTSWEPRGA